jgi:uncharacterized protein (TIGR03437 family)
MANRAKESSSTGIPATISTTPRMRNAAKPNQGGSNCQRDIHHGTKPATVQGASTKNTADPIMAEIRRIAGSILATRLRPAFCARCIIDLLGPKYFFVCALWLAGIGLGSAQAVITTFAGTDAEFTGDGQPALNAGLGLITGIAVDASGNVYFNDPDNHVVFRVGADGIIHVIAGNGIGGYSGDGGPATEASIGGDETSYDLQLSHPVLNGVAVDANGNVFITTGSVVRRIDTNGIITTYAGGGSSQPGDGGQATNAAFGSLLGLAVDSAGNVYFVDRTYATVRKVAPNGILSTIAGTGSNGFMGDGGSAAAAQLNNPIAVTTDTAGNVYIAEQGPPGRIRKITVANGIINTVVGGGTLAPGTGVPPLQVDINVVRAVAVDPAGDIFTYAPFNGILIKFAANGDSSYLSATVRNTLFLESNVPATEIFINGTAFTDSSLAVDSAGNLYTSQDIRGLVRKIDTNGILTTIAGNDNYRYTPDGNPAVSAQVRNPVYITVGADGQTLYFLSTNGLRRIGTDGILNTASTQSPFNAPFLIGITADAAGNLYTLSFNTVVRLSASGAVQTIVNQTGKPGSSGDLGPAAGAQLNQPQGLAVDKGGNLFIADTGNFKIRMVNTNGVINTIAGTGQQGHTGDGGAALSATFNALGGMLADNQGGVYVIDGAYIRHVLGNGTVEAVAGNGVSGFSGDGGKAVNASISVEFRSGMVLDPAGNLYFTGSDFESHIRRIAPNNTITTFAGTGTQGGFAGDGGPALNALFNEPLGLARDAAGNLYVADSGNNRIRVILATPPTATATPAQFLFQGNAGGAPPLAQYLTVLGTIDAVPFSIAQSANSNWLSLSTSSGVTPRLIQLQADPSQLTAGPYQATLMVQAGNAAPIPISVDFEVGVALPPQLSLDKSKLSFTYPLNAAAREALITVSDSGGGTLPFQASAQTATGGNWLSVSPGSGTATPAGSVALLVEANPSGLQPGTYRGTITVSSTGSNTVAVPVIMTISSASQAIVLSHAGLTFTTVQQGGVAPPQTFAVLNIGSGAMNWTATTTTLSGGGWLSATPGSGSSIAGSAAPKVTVTVNQTGLAVGRYYGLVRITAPGAANTPHVITVILRVLPSSTDIGEVVTPNELVFVASAGANSPSSQSLFVYNIAATPKTYSSSVFLDGASLNYLPGQATLALNAPTEIVVQPVTDGLTPGVYHGNLTLQFSDGRVRDVKLHFIVRNAPGGTANQARQLDQPEAAATCIPSKLIPTLTSIGQSFTVPAGWPVALQAHVVDDCGNPLDAGSVVVAFSNGDAPLNLLSLGNGGQWQATWSPNNSSVSAQLTITVNAEAVQPALQGSLEISGGFNASSDAPQLSGIVSGASFAPGVPLAPGAIVSVFGGELADASGGAAGLPLSSTLQGATVVIAGEPSPMFYASSGQLNAAIPFDITPNTSQQVLVTRDTTISVPMSVDVAPAQPAVFLAPAADAPNQGAIFAVRTTSSGQTSFLAGPSSPATAGDTLVIYCDGLGGVNKTIATGAGSPGSPAANTNALPQVTVGGVASSVAFSGLTPGLVGVYQINALVPTGVTAGDQVPVVINISGQVSPAVTIAVK